MENEALKTDLQQSKSLLVDAQGAIDTLQDHLKLAKTPSFVLRQLSSLHAYAGFRFSRDDRALKRSITDLQIELEEAHRTKQHFEEENQFLEKELAASQNELLKVRDEMESYSAKLESARSTMEQMQSASEEASRKLKDDLDALVQRNQADLASTRERLTQALNELQTERAERNRLAEVLHQNSLREQQQVWTTPRFDCSVLRLWRRNDALRTWKSK